VPVDLESGSGWCGHGKGSVFIPCHPPAPWSTPMSISCRSWVTCGHSTGRKWSRCIGASRSSRRRRPCSHPAAPASAAVSPVNSCPEPGFPPSVKGCVSLYLTVLMRLVSSVCNYLTVLKMCSGPASQLLNILKW
jgi:hypothetical protein